MKISEIAQPLLSFIATVRVVQNQLTITARIVTLADDRMHAKILLAEKYGAVNVLSLLPFAREQAIDETTAPLSAAELQVKSMSDRAKQLTQQAKQLKARQSLQQAQQKLVKASQLSRTH